MTAPVGPSAARTLRRLFLTIFLRGQRSRGIDPEKIKGMPTSVGRRLLLILAVDALFGLMALMLVGQPVFVLATYLHAMTLMLLGFYVASSAGEVLFNEHEADILLHRPIEPASLLWARIAMLVQVSLWMAGAFNLPGMFVGLGARDGTYWFPVVHAASVVLSAVFTTAAVVVVYQLCLRWFGRERLNAFMTATQVIVSIAVVLGGQIVPQVLIRLEGTRVVMVDRWWVALLPPSWFAAIDDALAGSGSARAWWLAVVGIIATAALVWIALVRLAQDYQSGLQTISESVTPRAPRARRRLIDRLVNAPPLSWWLGDSVSRASFRLVAAYLGRDRDVKLRVYPGIAPMLVLPVMILLPAVSGSGARTGGGVAFAGVYLLLVPQMALEMLAVSQHWQAADVFRLAPVSGPAAITHGVRRAVLFFLAFPTVLIYAVLILSFGNPTDLVMLLPGVTALPVFAMIPCLSGRVIPLSQPPNVYKATSRVVYLIGSMVSGGVIAGLAAFARSKGWLAELLIVETLVAGTVYFMMRGAVDRTRWTSLE